MIEQNFHSRFILSQHFGESRHHRDAGAYTLIDTASSFITANTMPKKPALVSLTPSLPAELLDFEQKMEWDVPELRAAQSRLLEVLRRLRLPEELWEKLIFPKRAVVSSIPIRTEEGRIKVFAGYLVNHSETLGPCQGQLRYHPDVTLGEVASMAMSATWKSGLFNLPLGGAQGAVRCNPMVLAKPELERITRRFTTEMVPVLGPDRNVLSPGLGTDEQTMAWMMDTYSQIKGYAVRQVVTGKPRIIGGSVGQREAPGRSVVYCIIDAAEKMGLELGKNTRVVVQGFGKLGRSAARKLSAMGCRVIAVNDIGGGTYNPKGLNPDDLQSHCEQRGSVVGFSEGEAISNEELFELECDILIPAATANQINERNAAKIKAKIVAEGANDCTSIEADRILKERDIFVIPDLLANAGGMVVSYFEWVQGLQSFFWHEKEVYHRLYRIISEGFQRVYEIAQREKVDMRTAALMAGVGKVAEAAISRGLYP